MVTSPAPAVVVTPVLGGWDSTIFSSSQWVSAKTDCGGPDHTVPCGGGPYVYQICWTQIGSGSVSLQFLADNDAVVCLNDASCPADSAGITLSSPNVIGFDNFMDPAGNFRNPALNTPPITNHATSGTFGGTNTLDINVGNQAGTASGFEVQGLLCGDVTLVTCPMATIPATATPTTTATPTATATPTSPACPPGLKSTSINTGQGSVSVGNPDLWWKLLSDPNGGFTAPAPAVVVTPVLGGWDSTIFSNSQWVSASTNCGGPGSADPNCGGGPYVYQICWTQQGSGSVSLQFLADNHAAVCLNDGSCTLSSPNLIGFDSFADPQSNFRDPTLNTPPISNAATSATTFSGAPNTLNINVANIAGTASGFEVQGLLCGNVTLVTCPCPTCALGKP